MNLEDYRKWGKLMVDYTADYLTNIRDRRVFPDVKPGYMKELIPDVAPEEGEMFEDIFADMERVIMPGITHWQSPYMHAYFPALNSPASLLGDMLSNAIGCLGFTWASSPACTELEIIVMDWLGKMIGLPEYFLHGRPNSLGGGVIQTSASEATFVALLAARTEVIRRVRAEYPELEAAEINNRLVAYCSDQAHSSVEKAGLIGLVKMRFIESDDHLSLRGDKLSESIKRDRNKQLIPFFLCATLGTTGACAFDNLSELGPICQEENIWIHVDAAYSGTAFICPEYRKWMNGIEYVDSFAFNPSKWMMVHFDCTAMWPIVPHVFTLQLFNDGGKHVTHVSSQEATQVCETRYDSVAHTAVTAESIKAADALIRQDRRITVKDLAELLHHWQIPLSKRFRALKLWFVIRSFGIKGIQEHVRKGVSMAEEFEKLVQTDDRFEIPAERHLGLVTFRLKGENELTERLLKKLNSGGKIHCVPSSLKGKYVIRFTVTSWQTTLVDIQRDWQEIQARSTELLQLYSGKPKPTKPISIREAKIRNPEFGTSLLLSNSPMTPKIMNGSFVAIFENEAAQEFVRRYGNTLRVVAKDSPSLRRRIRGLMISDKQYSLDSRMDLMNSIVATAVDVQGSPASGYAVNNCSREAISEEEDASSPSKEVSRVKMCKQCGHTSTYPA